MNKKTCDRCHQPSFSSRDKGTWICPVCQKDITYIKIKPVQEQSNLAYIYEAWKNRRSINKESKSTFSTYI